MEFLKTLFFVLVTTALMSFFSEATSASTSNIDLIDVVITSVEISESGSSHVTVENNKGHEYVFFNQNYDFDVFVGKKMTVEKNTFFNEDGKTFSRHSLVEKELYNIFTRVRVSEVSDEGIEVVDSEDNFYFFGGHDEFKVAVLGEEFVIEKVLNDYGDVIMNRLRPIYDLKASDEKLVEKFHGQLIFVSEYGFYSDLIILAEDNQIHRVKTPASDLNLKVGDEVMGSTFLSYDKDGYEFYYSDLGL